LETLLLTVHFIACILLIIVILLQSGHEGMGVIFGGSSSSTFFGSSGAGSFLVKLTVCLAIVFFCTSIGFSILDSAKKTKAKPSIILERPVNTPTKKSAQEVVVPKKENTNSNKTQK